MSVYNIEWYVTSCVLFTCVNTDEYVITLHTCTMQHDHDVTFMHKDTAISNSCHGYSPNFYSHHFSKSHIWYINVTYYINYVSLHIVQNEQDSQALISESIIYTLFAENISIILFMVVFFLHRCLKLFLMRMCMSLLSLCLSLLSTVIVLF